MWTTSPPKIKAMLIIHTNLELHTNTHMYKKKLKLWVEYMILSWKSCFHLMILVFAHLCVCISMCATSSIITKKKKKNFMLGVAICVSSRFHVVSSHEYSTIWVNLNLTYLVNMFGILNPHTISLLNRSIWHDSFNSFN